jgi:hypothetical protein
MGLTVVEWEWSSVSASLEKLGKEDNMRERGGQGRRRHKGERQAGRVNEQGGQSVRTKCERIRKKAAEGRKGPKRGRQGGIEKETK